MRTYARKKPGYQFIAGVNVLCRLCLGNSDVSIPIFTEDTICCELPLRIMICVGLEITNDDCLPNKICMKCYSELETYYTFRKKCEVTYQKLKSHSLAVKERLQQKVLEIKNELNEVGVTEKCSSLTNPDTMQHLLLNYNENQPMEPVNIVNMESPLLGPFQKMNGLTNEVTKQANIENETQDLLPNNTNPSHLDIEAINSDASLILSTILMELGMVQQQDGGLIVVDQNLKTVELEGEGNSRVVLELIEEEEQPTLNLPEEPRQNSTNTGIIKSENKKKQEPSTDKVHNNKKKGVEAKGKGGGAWCARCGRSFASPSALRRHARVHSGERPHACPRCGRLFSQREVMVRHQLLHQDTRPFQCDVCSKGFTQRSGLLAHRRAHAPSNRRALALHRCPHCTKVFLHGSGLSRHMMMHNGKLFVCDYCGHKFRDRSSLVRHLRSTHNTGPNVADTGRSNTGPSDTGPSDTRPLDTGPSDTRPSDTGFVDTSIAKTEPADK